MSLYAADGGQASSLGDLLERVLDKGLVIAGDIQVNLLDIELLTIKLRLVIASVETAREMGIDWWESDPWLSSSQASQRELLAENSRLRAQLTAHEGLRAHESTAVHENTAAAESTVPAEGSHG